MSKILPYLFFLILGILFFILGRIIFRKFRWIKFTSILFILIPISIYFILNPIYEGDFSNDFKNVPYKNELNELQADRLTIITIPNCPYCYESIAEMKKIKSRIPDLQIDFIVCTSDSSALEWYNEESNGDLNILLAKNNEELVSLSKEKFPTFVVNDNNKMLRVWSNNNFGVRAKDWIENHFK